MKYYSTNNKSQTAALREAVIKGLAPDRGLYMPENIKRLPEEFFNDIQDLSFQEISFEVAKAFFGDDVEAQDLKKIVYETLSFDCPVVHVNGNIWSLELFHGPTLAFKDVGARFMARMLAYFIGNTRVNVLVATSGDTGSAVANGFLGKRGLGNNIVICVPSGNFGNLTAGLFAQRMGLPVKRFIAANNANDVFLKYLNTGIYEPHPSIQTIANAMDVGAPSNFARITDMFNDEHSDICKCISGASYSDTQIRDAMAKCHELYKYTLDPHGACGWLALKENLQNGENGIFLETAHPAKFKETVENAINGQMEIPCRLAAFMKGAKMSIPMTNKFEDFKRYLISSCLS